MMTNVELTTSQDTAPATTPARPGGDGGSQLGVCLMCIKRIRLAPEEALDEARCDCGEALRPYQVPDELTASARGVLPRLIRFWLAGREDGYWAERRFFRRAAAERAGVSPRAVRFAYESGLRAGERLRLEAQSYRMRVRRMRAGALSGARVATGAARAA